MYLKRLEMLGFKSFAVRTTLEFSPGITAIVGPNGAGKSNVADAVRWVLGEQSMRQLRGKKSEDIIFAGGHGKSALGMAEVSLTIDNSTGWVPSDYSEITVTRRSYRSGENEYLINRQKVRLKDVLLLLAQARIGHDSYTVVGQGLIDAALSLRAEERRGLFEDAAGIRPYQVQRMDAENRLRQTEQNLNRLRDLVSEIAPRLGPLAEQARRAIEYRQVNHELQDVLLTWYALQWRRLHTVRENAERTEQEQARKVQQVELTLQAAEGRRESLRVKRQEAQLHIARAREAYNEANDTVKHIEREIAVNHERVLGLERQKEEHQQEERRLRERLIAAQRQVIDLEEQCDLADEAVDNDAASLASLEGEVAKAQKAYEMDERRLRAAQSDLIQVQARLGASQSDLGRQQKHLGERNRVLASRRETIAQSQQSIRQLEKRLLEERERLEAAKNEEQQILSRKQAISRALSDVQQEIERLKQTLNEAERQRRTVSDRLNMLKNWRNSLSGYSDGVRAILRAPVGKLSGLIGPMPQLMITPTGMELALEAALGASLQAVVVERFEDAQVCLKFLQQSKGGKALLIWLQHDSSEMSSDDLEIAMLERLLSQESGLKEHVKGLAWQCMRCEERYLPLFRRILHGVVIADGLDTAQKLLTLSAQQREDTGITQVATLQGEVLHRNGWLTGGGSKDDGRQGLLAYERELHELPEQLNKQLVFIQELNASISETQRNLEARRIELNNVEKELQKNSTRINECTKAVTTVQRDLDRLQTELQLALSVEQQLAAELAGLEQEVQAAIERVYSHEKSQREMAGLVEELAAEVEERTIEYRRQQDELGKARTALAVKRQEARALRQQLATQQNQIQDLKAQVEQRVSRMKEAQTQHHALQQQLVQRQQELAQSQAKTRSCAEQLRIAEEKSREIDQQVVSVEQEIGQVRQSLNELEIAYRRCLLDSQKARDALDTLLEQLQEEMGISDPKELSRYATWSPESIPEERERNIQLSNGEIEGLSAEEESELRKLRRRVETLRGRLKAIGGCDPDAPQQYEETRTRYEFLTSQITDMDQAALQLHAIIDQLDATMARQFEATFQAVNARFREHFTTLFNGGSARLELVMAKNEDEPDASATSMPTGVEVIVQPPGKKVQDLSLLSGGERALVSAALLFSLLEINPPPFCLLDEVDAALDESNVARFCDILKRLAQRTQFIVITHNRVTMTSSQVVYGVSMGGDSVSRLLSLKLEEVPVGGDR